MAIMPTRRTLTNQPPVQLINLGYATFDTGTTNPFFIESRGEGAAIMLTNRGISMAFLPPYAPKKNNVISGISTSEAVAHPKTFAYMLKWEADEMAAEMDCEETHLLPLSTIFFMNKDNFLLYSLKVVVKTGSSGKCERVEFFQSPYVKGITRYLTNNAYGKIPDKRLGASVFLTSMDGAKKIGLLCELADASSTNLFAYLDPVLRSFRFTVDSVQDREAIKALIRDAGIPQRKPTPEVDE